MDRRFLELFGNFLLNAAKSQKQFEDMTRWMTSIHDNQTEMTDLFRDFYGLDKQKVTGTGDSENFEQAAKKFQTSFKEWVDTMGFVSMAEYRTLKNKYDALKEKAADQENTIRRLKKEFEAGEGPPKDPFKGFTDLMEAQADQFQELMKRMGKAFKPDEDA